MTRTVPTAEFASLVFGDDGVALDDPAEGFHEASRLYPNVAPGRLATLLALSQSPELQQTVERASRRHEHRPGVDLPASHLPRTRLRDALDRRRSRQPRRGRGLALGDVASLLAAAYGSATRAGGVARRRVPSGGALYPLEVYGLPLAVESLGRSVFHYDPYGHRLETLAPFTEEELAAALVDPTIVPGAALAFVITAMFWRTRFKYGLRGYRFALLEAGHVVQNLTLVAAALDLPLVPLGGWYDRRVDALVGADGLDEASVYVVLVGGHS
jgi:SagB-type dehydrogenase family enzyme